MLYHYYTTYTIFPPPHQHIFSSSDCYGPLRSQTKSGDNHKYGKVRFGYFSDLTSGNLRPVAYAPSVWFTGEHYKCKIFVSACCLCVYLYTVTVRPYHGTFILYFYFRILVVS